MEFTDTERDAARCTSWLTWRAPADSASRQGSCLAERLRRKSVSQEKRVSGDMYLLSAVPLCIARESARVTKTARLGAAPSTMHKEALQTIVERRLSLSWD